MERRELILAVAASVEALFGVPCSVPEDPDLGPEPKASMKITVPIREGDAVLTERGRGTEKFLWLSIPRVMEATLDWMESVSGRPVGKISFKFWESDDTPLFGSPHSMDVKAEYLFPGGRLDRQRGDAIQRALSLLVLQRKAEAWEKRGPSVWNGILREAVGRLSYMTVDVLLQDTPFPQRRDA